MENYRDIVGNGGPTHKAEVLNLELSELAAGGRGLGRAPDGRVVFVEGGLAGEEVTAGVVAEKKSFLEARLLEVIKPSPHRVEPFCPLVERCGGCNLQHLAADRQAVEKTAWVDRALFRLEAPAAETLASPADRAYRNRVRFAAEGARIGFYAPGSRELVPVDSCPVAAPGVNALLAGLARELAAAPLNDLVWAEALAGAEGPGYLTLGLKDRTPGATRRTARELGLAAGAAGVRLAVGRSLEPWDCSQRGGVLYYDRDGLELRAFPGLFCQVNFGVNLKLIDLVSELAAEAPEGAALDIYAGSGNFGLPIAVAGREVLAVENSAQAAEAAAWQASRACREDRFTVRAADAAKTVAQLAESGGRFALAVLDPPRSGAKPLLEPLCRLAPERIIYVSCHAAALARDAAVLADAGYRLSRLVAVDQFPHTGHVEAVLALDRA